MILRKHSYMSNSVKWQYLCADRYYAYCIDYNKKQMIFFLLILTLFISNLYCVAYICSCESKYKVYQDLVLVETEQQFNSLFLLLLLSFLCSFIKYYISTNKANLLSLVPVFLSSNRKYMNIFFTLIQLILIFINIYYLLGFSNVCIKLFLLEQKILFLDGRISLAQGFEIVRTYTTEEKLSHAFSYLDNQLSIINMGESPKIHFILTAEMQSEILKFDSLKDINNYINILIDSYISNMNQNSSLYDIAYAFGMALALVGTCVCGYGYGSEVSFFDLLDIII